MNLENKTNFLALYLPAFHEIKENNEWWGKGFTEWNNVKKAKPLFYKHNQPQIPIDGYYDLSKKESINFQANLANNYGIDGFIFYHYWFNGKKLLETPSELLLKNKDIKMNFCFCWANEPWTRSWDGKNKEILINQEYGDTKDWIEHIKYLLKFFKDNRYIRIDNKPVLYIYSARNISNYNKMIETWNNYLKQNDEEELYIIEFISTFNPDKFSNITKAVVEFEPLYTTRFDISFFNKVKRILCKKFKITDYQEFNNLFEYNINRKRTYSNAIIYKSCFCGWDNSPRKGKKSMIVRNSTPKNFDKNLSLLLSNKRKDSSNKIVMINAWNEWGEGAVLEGTLQYKYQYLEVIKKLSKEYKDEKRN